MKLDPKMWFKWVYVGYEMLRNLLVTTRRVGGFEPFTLGGKWEVSAQLEILLKPKAFVLILTNPKTSIAPTIRKKKSLPKLSSYYTLSV